jgi:hypothetical protein
VREIRMYDDEDWERVVNDKSVSGWSRKGL